MNQGKTHCWQKSVFWTKLVDLERTRLIGVREICFYACPFLEITEFTLKCDQLFLQVVETLSGGVIGFLIQSLSLDL